LKLKKLACLLVVLLLPVVMTMPMMQTPVEGRKMTIDNYPVSVAHHVC